MKDISEMYGFIGVHPCYPKGTILLFETEADAKRCRNILIHKGVSPVSDNICECYIPDSSENKIVN